MSGRSERLERSARLEQDAYWAVVAWLESEVDEGRAALIADDAFETMRLRVDYVFGGE